MAKIAIFRLILISLSGKRGAAGFVVRAPPAACISLIHAGPRGDA
ncbi:hypothetical protein [Paraburkholderia sp. IW21]